MATPYPASESRSGEGTRNVPWSDCSLGSDPKCLDTSLNLFSLTYAIFAVLDLWNTTFPLLKLIFFSSPKYSCLRAGYCVYVCNDLTCSPAHALESFKLASTQLSFSN
ncbi:hypothetical protein E2C01_034767 [Portunus trituberculatus]|uniref:Uncharacterized protein n=1 Tax=Portunus trituberculatus TaxID=210409 RepID=A0A5B7F3P7_PORTR|nr:hypothetical protein [Portunus trituberculatus]